MKSGMFFSHFRMETKIFEKLVEILKADWNSHDGLGRPAVSIRLALYLTIWRVANQNSFREIDDRFNLGRGSVYRTFIKTTKYLVRLKGQLIKFPSTELSQQKTMVASIAPTYAYHSPLETALATITEKEHIRWYYRLLRTAT